MTNERRSDVPGAGAESSAPVPGLLRDAVQTPQGPHIIVSPERYGELKGKLRTLEAENKRLRTDSALLDEIDSLEYGNDYRDIKGLWARLADILGRRTAP